MKFGKHLESKDKRASGHGSEESNVLHPLLTRNALYSIMKKTENGFVFIFQAL